MRSTIHARVRAREIRQAFFASTNEGLLLDLTKYLTDVKKLSLIPMRSEQLTGSRGEVVGGSEMTLRFDRALSDPERLYVFAHELGHIELHKRLSDLDIPVDWILSSAYGDAGAAGIARYSPGMREETEANAFALEFLCPSAPLLAQWWSTPETSLVALAAAHGVEQQVVRIQLANALYDIAVGSDEPRDAMGTINYSPEQTRAASFTGKPALIDAGPGTGKTATLVRRIQALLEEQHASPTTILVLTFSNEAAQELRERIADRFGADVADQMTVSTFHGFGMEFLKMHGGLVGLGESIGLLDEDAQVELVSNLLGRVPSMHLDPLKNPDKTATRAVNHINFCKHRLKSLDDFEAALKLPISSDVKKYEPLGAAQLLGLWREYEREKQKRSDIDFADLINLTIRVLDERDDVAAGYRNKFPWVLVDEFQDVTSATSRLLRKLCGPENPPWVVGDARQSIYQFLGADPNNIRNFSTLFPDYERFELIENRRSSPPIVTAANQLGALLEGEDPKTAKARWIAVGDARAPDDAVAIARATSDYAESQGIAEQVRKWRDVDHVTLGDIAILARRHIDVRNAVLALAAQGITAQAAGLLTAEGAAGDLAVVLTAESRSPASIPRLAMALGRDVVDVNSINATVAYLLERNHNPGLVAPPAADASLVGLIDRVIHVVEEAVQSADGFETLTTFLFDSSDYLRRILDASESADQAMALVEIVSTLSLATAYRATHRKVQPTIARLAFASRLRARLTESQPIPIVPRPRSDAVRVMTCHASKGLEFPCVIVAGQTLPGIPADHLWLPPSLRPTKNEDTEQADSLLFVGVTRAKRAVIVSYPEKAGQGFKARGKTVVHLLDLWRTSIAIDEKPWTATGGMPGGIAAGPVWGASVPEYVKPAALDKRCPIETYIEQFLGIRFREAQDSLYPKVFAGLRRIIRALVRERIATGQEPTAAAVSAVVDAEFPSETFGSHPHFALYRAFAASAAMGFAHAFHPESGITDEDPEILITPSGTRPRVRLDFIANLRRPAGGSPIIVAFRPEPFAEELNKKGQLVWSKLSANAQTPFVLLSTVLPGASLRIYSGEDEAIYEYEWSRGADTLSKGTAAMTERHAALAAHDFSTDVDRYDCDRCRVRVTCPYWIGAISTTK
jgi:DNA helicase-2/ATP-dependent DNA helicase PcrA